MTARAEAIVEALVAPGALHSRVHPVFLPLSVRQNRIEDVFFDFLRWLRPQDEREAAEPAEDRTADKRAELIVARLKEASDRIRLPTSEPKLRLFQSWVRSELIVDPRATNRTSTSAVSIIPLHSAVARYFQLPGNPPAYGRFICELLAREPAGLDFTLLETLRRRFDEVTGDPVTQIVQAALNGGGTDSSEPRFQTIETSGQQVWAVQHARLYQRQIESVLAYSTSISRRTLVDWLYSLTTLFMATYFLRMARAARSYSSWLEARFHGDREPWSASVDDSEFSPGLPYAHRDESHARLLKRLPFFTSQAAIARTFVEAAGVAPAPEASGLVELGEAISATLEDVDAREVLALACDGYPTKTEGVRRWRLPGEEKDELLSIARDSDAHAFVVFTQYLNFEDMARSSNNIMEWQFYASLARNRLYGFARPGKGDALRYSIGERLLACVTHCHLHQEGERATLESFVAYLEELGFLFDGDGRQELERELVLAGLLEAFADASDAKYLRPTYQAGAST